MLILSFIITSITLEWVHQVDSFDSLENSEMGAGFMVMRYTLQIYRILILAKVSKELH